MSVGIPLTKRIIEASIQDAVAAGTEKWVWDKRAPGFAVRIKPTGSAAFVLRYRNSEGRLRKLSIGRFGPFTVDAARIQAFQHIAAIKGVERADPAASRRASRNGITVAELCDEYLTGTQNTIRASTLAMDRSRIEVHVKPQLGLRKVAGVKPADIELLLRNITTGKTATKAKRKGRGGNSRGGKAVAIRTARMLAVIFKRAVRDGVITVNPVTLVEKPIEDRYRPVFSWNAYTRLGNAMRELIAEGVNKSALDAILLLALTGARRSEILELKWAFIDSENHCLRLPTTKTIPQDRPIGAAAIEVISSLPKNGALVFPATRSMSNVGSETSFKGISKIWRAVRARAEMNDFRLHGLRHFFASAAHASGYSKFVVAGLLGHSVGGDTERYVSVIDSTLVEAANRVSAKIFVALGFETPPLFVMEQNDFGFPLVA